MKILKIIIKGIVQRVGYRAFVERIAKNMKIKGYVKNLDDDEESVEVLAQCENQKTLEEFVNAINITTDLIKVEKIEKQEVAGEGEFKKFGIIRGSYDEENAERLDIAAFHLNNLAKEVKTGNDKLGGKIDGLGDKIDDLGDNLGGKIDGLGDKIDNFSGATQLRFDHLDVKYGKVSDKLEKISHSLEAIAVYLPQLLEKIELKK